MKIISQKSIRNLSITPMQCIDWIYESFASKKEAQLPAKVPVHPRDSEFFTSMPCLLPVDKKTGNRYFGVKVVHRIEGAVPSLGSDILLYDANNGELLALVDGDWITAMRTGAVAAAAAKALRRSNSSCYGILGLGNTARATMLCVLGGEPQKKFHVKLLRYKNQAEQFVERFKDCSNVSFDIVDDVKDIAMSVDVLFSCVTCADSFIVEDEKIFPKGITIIPIHTKGFQNCDTTFDRVFGDDTEHVKNFRYFKQFKEYNEIGEVFAGKDPGRTSDEQRILNYNYGLGLHDVVYASKIYEMTKDMDSPEVEIVKETEKFWL
ncbi:MAG: hypothetical protein IKX42_03380 [Fibrobacter sp.]|nr:hypothetical protein [Fibrobacter sp.]